MDPKCSQDKFLKCTKNSLCHLCDGERLYKPPKEFKSIKKGPKKIKEGMAFEKRVTKTYNKSVCKDNNHSDIARRRPNSGAFWSLPGDIVTRDALFEAKERGSRTSSGEKTISVHREWLEKIRDETFQRTSKRYWFLPFGFKNDEKIYVITDFEIQLQLINIIHDQEEIIKNLSESLSIQKNAESE